MFRGAKKRTFRFGKKNVSFPKVETFRFADYRLLLILIDTQALGLTVSENFIPIEEEEDVDFPFAAPKGTGGSFNPYDHNNRPMNNGTVAMDGVQGTEPGGTKFM